MSGIVPGGSSQAEVIGCIIQELDEKNQLHFQWSSWDHIPISDTIMPLTAEPLRYMHCNGIEEDFDGNILLSSRNLSEITKIDRQTGAIIWRMGGKQNEFDFGGDRGFSVQHDVRRLPNGNLTLYDNADPAFTRSRGVEYKIDEGSKRVELVAEYVKNPPLHGWAMGNMQRLPGGNSLIGWGSSSAPLFTEFAADGRRLLSMSSPEGLVTYRAFRDTWQGYPAKPPVLAARVEGDKVHLHFSWNGSTETTAYVINAAQNLDDILPVATVPKAGFETVYTYEAPADGTWYFRVRPLNKSGEAGPRSHYVQVTAGQWQTYLPLATAATVGSEWPAAAPRSNP